MYTEQDFRSAVENSFNVTGILIYLKLSDNGNTRRLIKQKIKNLGIDISHFSNKIGKKRKDKKHWEDVLIKRNIGVRQSSSLVRRALLESGVEYKCNKCGLKKWNDEKLCLEIDHINNNCLDDRKENLQFLCPNCHSQKTIKFKVKTINNCKSCGKKISRNSQRCNLCASKIRGRQIRKVERPPKGVLLEEIKKYGYSAVGRKYSVSDNAIRKWIK